MFKKFSDSLTAEQRDMLQMILAEQNKVTKKAVDGEAGLNIHESIELGRTSILVQLLTGRER